MAGGIHYDGSPLNQTQDLHKLSRQHTSSERSQKFSDGFGRNGGDQWRKCYCNKRGDFTRGVNFGVVTRAL